VRTERVNKRPSSTITTWWWWLWRWWWWSKQRKTLWPLKSLFEQYVRFLNRS
jgi:hypothetical protein